MRSKYGHRLWNITGIIAECVIDNICLSTWSATIPWSPKLKLCNVLLIEKTEQSEACLKTVKQLLWKSHFSATWKLLWVNLRTWTLPLSSIKTVNSLEPLLELSCPQDYATTLMGLNIYCFICFLYEETQMYPHYAYLYIFILIL